MKVRWLQRAIRIAPVPAKESHSLRLEMWGAQRKSELLAEVAGIPVEIVAPLYKIDEPKVNEKELATAASNSPPADAKTSVSKTAGK